MTDDEMVAYLGLSGEPKGLAAVQKLTPERRALYERMATLETEVALWDAGLGPRPEGVLLDMARDKSRSKFWR